MTLAPIARADLPAACERLRALARLRLTARRLGCGLRLRAASRALEQMVAFCGLCDVLPVEERLLRGSGGNGGQPEQRKQPGRVEERVEARDPPV